MTEQQLAEFKAALERLQERAEWLIQATAAQEQELDALAERLENIRWGNVETGA